MPLYPPAAAAAHTHPKSEITGIADDSLVGRILGEADAGVSIGIGFGLGFDAGPTLRIDDSVLALVVSGGTDGQVLTKQSADDYDYDWEDASGGGTEFPVGFIFMSVVSTNPNTLLGYGTWVAFGAGRMPIGLDSGNAAFDTVEETGGAETVTLDTTMIPAHTHTQNAHTHTQDSHFHTPIFQENGSGSGTDIGAGAHFSGGAAVNIPGKVAVNQNSTATNQNATATNQNTGGGAAHNNMPPYIVVYMFKRTA